MKTRKVLFPFIILFVSVLSSSSSCKKELNVSKEETFQISNAWEIPETFMKSGDVVLNDEEQNAADSFNSLTSKLLLLFANNQESSYVFSPVSLQLTLGMLSTMVLPEYRQRIVSDFFGDQGPVFDVDAYAAKLLNVLPSVDKSDTIAVANLVAAHPSMGPALLDEGLLRDYYHAPVSIGLYTLENNARINRMCSEYTHGKIPSIIPEDPFWYGEILLDTYPFCVVLISTLLVKAPWWEDLVEKGELRFHCTDRNARNFKNLEDLGWMWYYENDKYKAVSRRIGVEDKMEMLMVLPRNGIESLSTTEINDVIAQFDSLKTSRKVNFHIPEFKISNTLDMKEIFPALGYGYVMEDKMVLCNEIGMRPVSNMLQPVDFSVDKDGLECASATQARVISIIDYFDEELAAAKTVDFIADRPFYFIVRVQGTDIVLFAGAFTGL